MEGGEPSLDLLGEDRSVVPTVTATRPALGAALIALLLACSAAEERPASPPSSPAVEASPRSAAGTPAPVPAAPAAEACYRLAFEELARPTNPDEPVSCTARHNTQTIFVGDLDTVRGGHLVAVDSQAVQDQLATTCPRKLREFVGGTRSGLELSRFKVVWFSPTVEQSDLGANWFRCDLVVLAAPQRTADLPPTSRLRGVLGTGRGLDEFGLCGTAAPGASGFQRVMCGARHSWRAISVIDITGGERYPGRRVVRLAGEDDCRDQVDERLGSPNRFSYGWEWPTRAQWERGQHHGYCWAPD